MRALCFIALAACATSSGPGDGDDVGGGPDAAPRPDAADVDAAAETVTLSQSTSTTITAGNTQVCASNLDNVPQYTLENHFYRAFPLAVHGVTGELRATRVDLAIEQAETVAGSQTIQVRLHSAAGTFPAATLSLLREVSVVVPDMNAQNLAVDLVPPVTVAGGSNLVLEVVAPAHAAEGNFFFPGSNTAGESAPSYIMAPGCSINSPTPYSDATPGVPVHLIMTITGTTP